MEKNDRKLGRRMLAVYQETDSKTKDKAAAAGSACKKGCASCCSLLISVTFPEAVAVAEHVLAEPRFQFQRQRIHKRIYEQVQLFHESVAKKDPSHYFNANLPCAFLDEQDKTCDVYKVRPSSCRLHNVTSDPADCVPTSETPPVRVDMGDEANRHLNEAYRVSRQVGVPLWSGPYPIMLAWAFKLLKEGRKAIELAHMTEDLGMTSLNNWRLKAPVDEEPSEASSQSDTP